MQPLCPFCEEILDPVDNEFARLYGRSRTHLIAPGFHAMPTLGQLFPYSLLVVPAHHCDRFADLDVSEVSAGKEAVERASSMLRPFGHVVTFEHGAVAASAGGCGIYHAHVHVVPLPVAVSWPSLLPDGRVISDLVDAWALSDKNTDYLVIRDTYGTTAMVTVKANNSQYPSQYFRRALQERLAPDRSWDWRSYSQPEPDVFEALLFLDHQLA